MWPDRVLNPGPLTSQVPYRLRYAALLKTRRPCIDYVNGQVDLDHFVE